MEVLKTVETPVDQSTEDSAPSKMQIKLLIERVRVIENQQLKVDSNFKELENSLLERTKEQEEKVSKSLAELEEIKTFQPKLKDLMEKIALLEPLEADTKALHNQITEILTKLTTMEESMRQSIQTQIKDLQNKHESMMQLIDNLKQNQETTKSNFLEIQENLLVLKESLEKPNPIIETLEKRISNLEKHVGLTTGDLFGDTYDSGGVFKQLTTELVDKGYADSLITDEVLKDQVGTVRAIKTIIMKLAGMDSSRIPDITEILLRYADHPGDQGQASDRRNLFLAFNTDIRRVCEIGQAVLMDIGVKRNFTRRICQEAHTVAGKWDSEAMITSDTGVKAVLDLFDTLEQEYLSE